MRGLEAFLRWRQPGMGVMQASEFMPQVEKQRLGSAVGEWVMNAVFSQYQQWLRQGLPMVPISINIGDTEFATQDLLGLIEKLGALYATGWQWLRLDITEQAVIADVGHAPANSPISAKLELALTWTISGAVLCHLVI